MTTLPSVPAQEIRASGTSPTAVAPWRALFFLTLLPWTGLAHAQTPAPPVAAPPGTSAATPTPPPPPPFASIELGDNGSNAAYSYQRDPDFPEIYHVTPSGSSDVIYISEPFLKISMSMAGAGGPAATLEKIRSYPGLVEAGYNTFLDIFYPDAESPGSTISEESFDLEDGTNVVIKKDPLAAPYARVTITGADGAVEEYTASSKAVEPLLATYENLPLNFLGGLRGVQFRLPDELREKFSSLSPEEWRALVEEVPEVAKQEMVRMKKLYLGELERPKKSSGISDRIPEPRVAPGPDDETSLPSPAVAKGKPETGATGTEPGGESASDGVSPVLLILSLFLIASIVGLTVFVWKKKSVAP